MGPEFLYFLVLRKFLGKPSVGGGNKNKNKIQKKKKQSRNKNKSNKTVNFFLFFFSGEYFGIIFSKYVLGVLIRIISMRQIY